MFRIGRLLYVSCLLPLLEPQAGVDLELPGAHRAPSNSDTCRHGETIGITGKREKGRYYLHPACWSKRYAAQNRSRTREESKGNVEDSLSSQRKPRVSGKEDMQTSLPRSHPCAPILPVHSFFFSFGAKYAHHFLADTYHRRRLYSYTSNH